MQLWFASTATLYVVALWIYHAVDPNVEEGHRFDRQVRVTLILLHVALGVAWLAGAVLWRWPAARTRGSELQAAQVSVLVALFCWGLPATAREMCSDTYNTFDGNLQQTLFVLICYAAIFCRVGTGAFVVLCALTLGRCRTTTSLTLTPTPTLTLTLTLTLTASSSLGACGASWTTNPSPWPSRAPSSSPPSPSSPRECAAPTCTCGATSRRAS